MQKQKILFADNDNNFLRTRSKFLVRAGFEVQRVSSVEEARRHLNEHWYHLAILDNRLIDDDSPTDLSGLLLAHEGNSAKIPRIILTAYEYDLYKVIMAKEILVLRKQDPPELMVRAVSDLLSKRVRINWKLEIRAKDNDSAPARLLDRISPMDIPDRPERVGEIEDLFRKLFYEKDSVTLQRLLWQRDGRLAVLVSAGKESVGSDLFVVTLGDCEVSRLEAARFREFAPKMQGDTATALYLSDETTHFGANVFAFYAAESETIEPIELLFRAKDRKVFPVALETLFGRTLTAWHRGDPSEGGRSLDELYRERLCLGVEHASCADLQGRVECLVQQSGRFNQTLAWGDEGLKLISDGRTFAYVNPVPLILQSFNDAHPAWTFRTSGTFSGRNILCDGAGRTWVTDFMDAGTAPLLWNFTSVEAMVRFDWTEHSSLASIHDLERRLTVSHDFSMPDAVDSPHEFRQCLKAVSDIRKLALPWVKDDLGSYHWGMFFHAARRLAAYDPSAGLEKPELARLLHALLSAAIIATVAAKPAANRVEHGVRVEPDEHSVRVDGRLVRLERRLFKIAAHLHKENRLCTRKEIFEAAFPGEIYQEGNVDQNRRLNRDMHDLRERIGERYIETQHGVGYRLVRRHD